MIDSSWWEFRFFKFPNRRFWNFYCSFFSLFLLLSFFNGEKVKYLSHLVFNHPILSVNLPMVIIYKCCKKIIFIQPQESLENIILAKFDQKSSHYKKFHKRQNGRKGRFTHILDIKKAHFWGNCKKVKNEITGTEKRRFCFNTLNTFKNWSCDFNLNFFAIFSKMRQSIIDPNGNFVCTSNLYNSFFSKGWKAKYLRHL